MRLSERFAVRAALVVAVLAAALAGGANVARADLMTACASEIGKYCPDVATGRGRVVACLAAWRGSIGAACQKEVTTALNSRLTPADMRASLAPGASVALPAACTQEAAKFCRGVPTGDGRVLACLYARGNRVDATCRAQARAAMK